MLRAYNFVGWRDRDSNPRSTPLEASTQNHYTTDELR